MRYSISTFNCLIFMLCSRMPKTYSQDFRHQVLSCLERGKSREEICDFFGISLRTLVRWISSSRNGSLSSYNTRESYTARKIDSEQLLKAVKDNPDATLEEYAKLFGCCFQAIDRRLRKLGVTRKKNDALRGEKRGRKASLSNPDQDV